MQFKLVSVTPHMAAKWLEKNNSNRGLSAARVSAYARDMVDGNWQVTPQPIVFNVNGDLLDGQHRLNAVIECGKPIQMLIAKGCDHDIRKYIDRGRPRSLKDRLRMEGVDGNIPLKAAVARNLVLLDRGGPNIIVTDNEATAAMEKYARGFTWLESVTVSKEYRRAPFLATVVWSLPLGERVVNFHEGVQTGVELKAGSPELAMRKFLSGVYNKGGQVGAEIILKTANCIHAALEGRQVRNVYASSIGYKAIAKAMKKRIPDDGRLLNVVV